MENFFSRYKNPLVLMAVLFVQVIYLATQVPAKRAGSHGPMLLRVWVVTAVTPFERAFVATGHFFRNTWHDYIDLHGVRKQNRELQEEITRLRLEQVRLRAGADQNRRLQALLDFKERYVGQTIAAQVIQSSGSEQSRLFYIDKGWRAGLKTNMAVITPDGIVGKVREVYDFSSQVLMINDRESGAGVILENSRLHGVLHGKGQGELQVNDIMSDEKVDVGEQVVTSGGDRIYPKGLPVGTVTNVAPDSEGGPFLAVTVRPAANLDRLEEVLVVTRIAEESPPLLSNAPAHRAADVLAQRLPSVSRPEENPANNAAGKSLGASTSAPAPAAGSATKKQVKLKTGDPRVDQPANAAGAVSPGAAETGASVPPASPPPQAGEPEKPPR